MNLTIYKISKDELTHFMLVEAKKEGWLYSQADVNFYFSFPYNQIYAVSVDGQLAGCLIRYESPSHINNMPVRSAGFFLVLEKFRGKKIVGPYLWDNVITKAVSNTLVCFHSVPRAVNYYDSLSYKKTSLINLTYILKNKEFNNFPTNHNLKQITENNYCDIEKYNQTLFPGTGGLGYREFIQYWAKRPDAIIIAFYDDNNIIKGYGIATCCHENNYRISPLYADTPEIANEIVKALINILEDSTVYLFTLSDLSTKFGNYIKELGFEEKGKNYVVCNHPELINAKSNILNNIFCSLPLEYPHEIIGGLQLNLKITDTEIEHLNE